MAFNLQGWARTSASANEPVSIQLNANNVPIAANGCFRSYNYYSQTYTGGNITGDTQAQISTQGYFNEVAYDLQPHDIITVFSGFEIIYQRYYVAQSFDPATGAPDVIIAPIGPTRENLILNSANIIAMSAAPVQILEAPGVGEAYQINGWSVNMHPVAGPVAYTGGTNIVLQYDQTGAGIGPQAAAPIPAAAIAGGTVSRSGIGGPAAALAGLTSVFSNAPVYMSSTTAFAAGNGNVSVSVSYEIIQLL